MSADPRPVKLLLDENLSPWAAAELRAAGVDAVHVRERSLLGATDAEVLDRAYAEDRQVVTSNIKDFVALCRATEVHAGIVLFEEVGLRRDEQLALLESIVELLAEQADMVNRALTIRHDGTHRFLDIP